MRLPDVSNRMHVDLSGTRRAPIQEEWSVLDLYGLMFHEKVHGQGTAPCCPLLPGAHELLWIERTGTTAHDLMLEV